MTKSIKRLKNTHKVKKQRRDGVKQHYWVGKKAEKPSAMEKMSRKTLMSLNRAWEDIKNGRVYDERDWLVVRKQYGIPI